MENLDYQRIEKAIDYIEANYRQQPSLEEVAKHVGLSQFHLQRLFTKWAGVSPKRFLQFITLENIKQNLATSSNLLDVTYEVGLSSTSRLYELFANLEAVTPKEFQGKGQNLKISYGFHHTPFGLSIIAITELGICHFAFITDETSGLSVLANIWPQAEFINDQISTEDYINNIFSDQTKKSLRLILKGTNFQVQVWKALLTIPPGNLATYEIIANKISNPKATRAVGTAIGSNNIAFLIPCHRVIRKTGLIGDYRWSHSRKKAILGWEASQLLDATEVL